MDLLTHLFLPITVAYVLRPDLFPTPWHFSLAVVAVAPDFDKLLGLQGAFHSAITLGVVGGVLVVLEDRVRNRRTYATLVAALLFSHLLLDFLDGGPIPFLYPLLDVGVGLHYPTEFVIGDSVGTTGVRDPLPTVRVDAPDRGPATYPAVNGYGVLSALVFLVVYVRDSIPGVAIDRDERG